MYRLDRPDGHRPTATSGYVSATRPLTVCGLDSILHTPSWRFQTETTAAAAAAAESASEVLVDLEPYLVASMMRHRSVIVPGPAQTLKQRTTETKCNQRTDTHRTLLGTTHRVQRACNIALPSYLATSYNLLYNTKKH